MISNYGRVFHRYLNKYIKISQDGSGNGYYFFMASTENGPKPLSVHRALMMCFNPVPNQNQLQVNHIDGNCHNNYIENLEWCTRSENILHSYNTGLHSYGENNSLSTITDETAIKICELLSTGLYTNEDIANIIGDGTTISIVSSIKQRQSWTHISKHYHFNSRPGRLFNDEQINNLCYYFSTHDRGNLNINDFCREALKFYGYDFSDRYVDTVRKIYGRKYSTNISCNYSF